jgi:hypothetical protein
MAWTDTFDSVFWLSIATGVFGFLGVLVKYTFRSKCDQVNFCGPNGLLAIHRQVELENSDEESDSNNLQRK